MATKEELQEVLTTAGVEFHPNLGEVKLQELVDGLTSVEETDTEVVEETDTEVVEETDTIKYRHDFSSWEEFNAYEGAKG